MRTDEKLDFIFYIIGWCLIGILGILIAVVKIIGTAWLAKVGPCLFHAATGLYCPGCGGTRATFALFRGEFIRSFKFHPFVPYAAVIGGWFMISQTIQRVSGNRIRIGMRYRDIYMWIAVVIILLNFIIKNGLLLFANIALLG